MSEKPTIGFVGVGRMGANMARRLHDKRYPITAIFDVDQKLSEAVADEFGAEACKTLERVTALADVIITVVPDDDAMKRIFSTQEQSLLTNAKGKLFINCATVSPGIHKMIETAAATRGADTLEACMASSITQAREGTLYLMCGGLESVFNRARPILEDLASQVRFIGPAGTAAQVKALVNMVMNANTAALAEGLALGDALGIDLTLLREVFSQTGAASRVLETDGEDMQNREHDCYFSAAHAAKDSGIALELAAEQQLDLPVARATKAQYDRMVQLDLGHLDKSGIAEITFKDRHK